MAAVWCPLPMRTTRRRSIPITLTIRWAGISYQNAIDFYAFVTFAYDPNYNRVTSMTDGTGSTTYSYNPITGSASLGAGQLATVSDSFAGATISYAYDELGRATNRAIDSVNRTVMYDGLKRLTNDTSLS